MVRKTLLSLTLIGVIVMPDIGSAQAGNYDLTGVHNIYHYLVREMDNSVGDSLDGSYEVKAHWPNAYNSLFDATLVNFEVGDTIGPVIVSLPTTAHLQGFPAGPIAINVDLYEAGNMVITGTYPSIATADCSTAATVPAVTDNATWQSSTGDPIVVNNDSVKSSAFGWGFVESGVFANNMYAPDLNTEVYGTDYGDGTANETWGKWTSFYNDDFSEIQTVHMYWEQVDGVSSTYGVDEQGNFDGHFGVTGAFGDRTTIPGLASLNPAINVGTYPMIGGSGHDVNMDGNIDAADGYLANPTLEWGYYFDPKGANDTLFDGDEPMQFTGYYMTYNFLAAASALATAYGQFSDPAILVDTDADGIPDTHPLIVYYMGLGLDQASALVATADTLANLGMQGLCVTLGQAALAPVLGPVVGDYAGVTLTALLTAGVGTVDALTQTGAATGAYAIGALAGAGVNVNDSDHDYTPAGLPITRHVVEPGFEAGADTTTGTNPVGWSGGTGYGGNISTVMDTTAHMGNYALQLGVTGTGGYAVAHQSDTTAQGGQVWTLSAWIRDVATGGSGGDYAALKMEAYDAAGNQVMNIETIQTGVTSDWAQYSATFTMPATAVKATAVLVATAWNGTAYNVAYQFDDVEISYTQALPNGRLVFQIGNVCIPRNQHLEVNAYYVNTATYGVDVDPDESLIPKKFALYDNFPNPFNPTTQIAVDLPEAASTKITVWNIMGQKVATLHSGDLSAGHHVVNFDGRDQNGKQLTSGMYFYRVTAGKYNAIKKMTLLK
jgi:hypothetical protein